MCLSLLNLLIEDKPWLIGMNKSRAYAMLVKNVKCPSLKFGGIVRPATQSSQLTDSQSAIHASLKHNYSNPTLYYVASCNGYLPLHSRLRLEIRWRPFQRTARLPLPVIHP